MNVAVIAKPDSSGSIVSYCAYSGATKYFGKTKVTSKSKTVALCVLGLISLLSFGVLIYSGLQANLWLLIAGFGPLLTSGFAILRVWARSK